MNSCPAGMLCITHSSIIIIIILILIIIFYFYTNNMLCKKEEEYKERINKNISNLENKIMEGEKRRKEYINEERTRIERNNMNNINNINNDDRLIEPVKEYPMNRINIETRGRRPEVQQLGTLSRMEYMNNDKDVGQNKDPYILPIYGRPTYNRSSKWNYYTIFNGIKLNISYNNKSCMNEYGCEELMNGDEIKIPEINGVFKVNIYENNKMQYIPL